MKPVTCAALTLLGMVAVSAAAGAEPLRELRSPAERAQAQARLEQLRDDLMAHHSATAVLQAWCGVGDGGARIVARREPDAAKPADARVRGILGVGAGELVRFRRVALVCGDQVLSEADNWYLPGRLTPEMNRLLDATETPFGVAVAGLDFSRRTLSADLLFRPADSPGPVAVPRKVLRMRAVLETPDGRPLSLVVETYRREVLALPPR